MTEIERIQDDLDKGYTVTRYGNTKALHKQMLKDIKYLNDLAKNNESLHDVSHSDNRYCEDCGGYVKDGCDNKDCKDFKSCG